MERAGGSRVGGAALLGGATIVTSALGGAAARRGLGVWYRDLRKPAYQPPSWVFAPVWTVLYVLGAGSAYRVWRRPASPARRLALGLWGAQLALNAAWSPLFFGRHAIRAALVDLAALIPAAAAYTAAAARVDPPAAWMVAPYLAWLAFAGMLNAGIARLNPRR